VIAERLRAAVEGQGSVVLIQGPAGTGKSRLVEEAVSIATQAGVAAGVGLAGPDEELMSLLPLLGALFDPGGPLLDRSALPELRELLDQPYWLLEELASLLERAALERSLLVAIDDMQWADSLTIAAFRGLASRTADLPVVWLGASRPGDLLPALDHAFDYLERAGARRLAIGPLDSAAAIDIICDKFSAEPDHDLISIAETADGNPFALLELLDGLIEDNLVEVTGGIARLTRPELPTRVRDSMHNRLDRLSALAGRLANVGALMGATFALTELANATRHTTAEVVGPVEELIRADILSTREGRLRFRHELIRKAVLEQIPAAIRRPMQRDIVDMLLAGGATPVAVAPLIISYAEPGDRAAVMLLSDAARALTRSQPAAAADLYRSALAFADEHDAGRSELVADAALLLHSAGQTDEASSFAARALREALPPDQEAEIRLSIAGMLMLSPDVRADASRSALLRDGVSAPLRARHLSRLVLNLCNAGRLGAARGIAIEAHDAVRATGDPTATFALELGLAGIDHLSGDFSQALKHTFAAERAAFEADIPEFVFTTRTRRCDVLAIFDQLDEAIELATDGLAVGRRDSYAPAVRCWEIYIGRYLLQRGRLSDAAAVLEGLFAHEDDKAIVGAPEASGLLALARIALHIDEDAVTRVCNRIARSALDASPPEVRRHAAWTLALQSMARGDARSARNWLDPLRTDDDRSFLPLLTRDVCDYPNLVRIGLASGDRGLAENAARTIDDIQSRNPSVESIRASAAHATGLLDADAPSLHQAAELFSRSPRPLAWAAALEDIGGLSLQSKAAAVDAYNRAIEIYAAAGANGDVHRVRARLRQLGVRRRLTPSKRPEDGWCSLTSAEMFVVRRVAAGLTNREVAEELFVSPHTVSTHLRHAYRKLSINSRVELTRIALVQENEVEQRRESGPTRDDAAWGT
jgi:DNA-binding CsgD family transcriptional regulator